MTDVHSVITENIDVWTSAIKKRNSQGRGSSKKIELAGVKKLRELILELAVRGKLVAQETSDEPASVLLRKIAAEKAQLVKDKKIKKSRPLPEINFDEIPFELSKGWLWERLGNLGLGYTGKTPSTKVAEYFDGEIPFIGPGQITLQGELLESDKSLTEAGAKFSAEADIGDILMVCIGGSIGKSTIANRRITFNQQINVIHPIIMPSKFLNLAVSTKSFYESVLESSSGTATPIINRTKWEELLVPVAPLAEQHRIVAKVDELMVLCDQLEQQTEDSITAHKALVEILLGALTNSADADDFNESWKRIAQHFDILFTTEDSIDQLKQTILQLAVMGKLVPQDPSDLPAPQDGKWFIYVLECEDGSYYKGFTQDILKRWKQHATGEGADWTVNHPPKKLVHWEEFDDKSDAIKREKELKTGYGRKWLSREISAGRTRQAGEPASVLLEKIAKEKKRLIAEGKIKKQKALPEIGEDEKPFGLPVGWGWARIGDLLELKNGYAFKSQYFEQSATPYVLTTPGHFYETGGFRDRGSKTRFYDGPIQSEFILNPNDLIIPMTEQAPGLLGSAAFIPEDGKTYVHNQRLGKLIPYSSLISREYLYLFFNSYFLRSELAKSCTGTTVRHTSPDRILKVTIPIMTLAEQYRIVSRVNELLVLCEQLKAQLSEAQITQLHLADAIVEQAV